MATNATTTTDEAAPAKAARAKRPPLRLIRTCPECGNEFETSHRGKAFCCETHRATFMNRCAARGKTLLPLAMGWRNARGRSGIGSQAMAQMVQLLDQFAAEDSKAGRPNMMHYTDHLMNHSVNLRWNDGRRGTRTA